MSNNVEQFSKVFEEFQFDSIKNQLTEDGFPLTTEFADFITEICLSIKKVIGTEENVHQVEKLEDWKFEIGSFLRELQCPYDQLYIGDPTNRLENNKDRILLVEFLHGEWIACQRIYNMSQGRDGKTNVQPLYDILNVLKLSQPPSNVSSQKIFSKFIERIQGMPQDMKNNVICDPLWSSGKLSESQWHQLNEVAKQLESEYALRRSMLTARLTATLQSFSWSGKKMPKHVSETISSFTSAKFSHINASDLLAARINVLKLKKISSDPPETRSCNPLTKIKVGRVPDRGGRPSEQAAPPPEMPSWQQRSGKGHDANNFQGQRGGYNKGGHGSHGGGGGHGGHHGGGDGRYRNRGVQGAGWKRN